MKTSSFVWMTDNRQRSRTLNTHKLYHGFLNKAFLYNFIFQTLLQQGHSDANAIGRNSYTPLHLAAEMDNEKICQILVRRFLRECHIPFFFDLFAYVPHKFLWTSAFDAKEEMFNMLEARDKEKIWWVPDGILIHPWPPRYRSGALTTEQPRSHCFSLYPPLPNFKEKARETMLSNELLMFRSRISFYFKDPTAHKKKIFIFLINFVYHYLDRKSRRSKKFRRWPNDTAGSRYGERRKEVSGIPIKTRCVLSF